MEKVNFSKVGPYSGPRKESRHYASHVSSRETLPQHQPQMHSSIRGKRGGPPKDPLNSESDLDEGEDGKRSQPPLPPIPLRWGGVPPN
jgi:hypothetical protein